MLPLGSKILQTKDNELLHDDRNIESQSRQQYDLVDYLFIWYLFSFFETCDMSPLGTLQFIDVDVD